ncbi:MAG: lysophospholipid acyltransferase family protein, partial [Deltaproteobacteria bacterium]|nr:lysophospholipid acyltransferase family protein [Deltaproteobacteria bacterium]
MANETSNVHVLPLRKKTVKKSMPKPVISAPSKESDFSGLVANLEKKISKIEIELKDSIQLLESDLETALRKSKPSRDEKEIKEDLTALAGQLEERLKVSLGFLSKGTKGEEKDRLEGLKSLSSQLVKVLSFDFYKSVLDKLTRSGAETEVDPFGMDESLVARIKPVFDYLYYKYWRVTTTGLENIPTEGKALIVGNHSGTLPYDGAMISAAVHNEHPKRKGAPRFLVEDFVFHMPMMGSFMYKIGGVRACPENAERLLNSGHLVVVFPEGVKGIGKFYRQRYKLQRFGRGGFIKICMKTGSPLIPVGVLGAEEIHPIIYKSNILAKTIGVPYIPITPTFPLLGLLGCIPLPTKWSIHFGRPIKFDAYGEEAMQDDL